MFNHEKSWATHGFHIVHYTSLTTHPSKQQHILQTYHKRMILLSGKRFNLQNTVGHIINMKPSL